MVIKSLDISNFKSLRNISIKNPNAFTALVGPNAAGKSNIFEALEFLNYCNTMSCFEAMRLFGGMEDIKYNNSTDNQIIFQVDINSMVPIFLNMNFGNANSISSAISTGININSEEYKEKNYVNISLDINHKQYFNFTKLFIGDKKLNKTNFNDDLRLAANVSNLEKVLKRIFKDDVAREEIIEWLSMLIPEFKNLEIRSDDLTSTDALLLYEKHSERPFSKTLLSDGTHNIIAILAALYQSKEPQFLCIEEPENGLNPKVAKELVKIFRQQCKEKGHFIWINTHSQSIVSELTTDEIILVDKVEGETKIKQIQGMDLKGMKMDEALFTNAIGGGIPW